jgi:hypothetical protein
MACRLYGHDLNAMKDRFAEPIVAIFNAAKILGVRAGADHRYTGVWVVVVEGRVFVRSWNDKPTGWYRAFRREPQGSVQLEKKELGVMAKETRSERIRKAVSEAYARKYNTKASQKWVDGFAEPEREQTTLELVPDR